MTTVDTPLGPIDIPEAEAKFIDFRGYRGNQLLKRAGIKIAWTPELIREYKKCSQDPIYFMEKHIKIVHQDRGLVPFRMYDYQKELVHNMHNNRYTITVMARQSGKSTAVVAYLLWTILFNDHKTILLLANKADTAREILGKAQVAYLHIPAFLQQGIPEGGWNKGSITLENGSRAIAMSSGDAAARGYSAFMLVLDETAHIEHWEAFAQSTLPIISSGKTTKITMISTPNGLNHFYTYWTLAQLKDVPPEKLPPGMKWNGYVPLHVTWRQVPGRDNAWFENTMQQLNFDELKFQQEYECVMGDTMITLYDKETKKALNLTIAEAYDLINGV